MKNHITPITNLFKINDFKRFIFWVISGKILKLLVRTRFRYFRVGMMHPPYPVLIRGKENKIYSEDMTGYAGCYGDIVIEDCYGIFHYAKHFRPKLIVDIGASIGIFSKLCSMLFPYAEIYAYEPNPRALIWLHKNAQDTQIKVLPCAVCDKSGIATFDDSTMCPELAHIASKGNLVVKTIATSEVADGKSIDFLKSDCEGSEWSILQDTKLLMRTQELRLEYHLVEGHTLKELRQLIESGKHQILRIDKPQERGGIKVGFLWSRRA